MVDSQEKPEQVEQPGEEVQATQEEVRSAFWSAVERGGTRLDRHWLGLIATGAAAGLDVGVGAFGLLVVMQTTRNLVLASLTFSIGFIIVVSKANCSRRTSSSPCQRSSPAEILFSL